jgi:hypothetical protein
LWWSKLAATGLALAGVVLLNWVLLFASAPFRGFLPNLEEIIRPAIAMLGGAALGLFWSVRLRQTWAALWMSLITPGALMMLIQLLAVLLWPAPETNLVADQPDVGGMFAFGFCLVGVLAFILARQGFQQLEDLGPVGEDVQLKAPRFVQNLLRVGARPERSTRTANSSLWWKEIRLQQVNLALAGGFALILLFLHFVRHAALSTSGRFSPKDFEFVEFLWALWSLLPLTIGLATLAEERRLGVD